jgi:hypothetical protein
MPDRTEIENRTIPNRLERHSIRTRRVNSSIHIPYPFVVLRIKTDLYSRSSSGG